jgi:hypothetical protein
MFRYNSLEDISNLDVFLELASHRENHSQEKIPKENIITKISDYFTGNSNIVYAVVFNKETKKINYSYPRTFSQDIKKVGEYFSRLIKNN